MRTRDRVFYSTPAKKKQLRVGMWTTVQFSPLYSNFSLSARASGPTECFKYLCFCFVILIFELHLVASWLTPVSTLMDHS